jgi:hypothetical protein
MEYKEHRPAYFSGFDQQKLVFKTLSDLFDSDTVVGNFAKSEDIVRFSFSPYIDISSDLKGLIMAEMKNGEYWVTGYLYGSDEEIKALGLPLWKCRSE